jgi:anti-sigma factor RsiW
MKHEVELKIQGYLDNELAAAEMREIAELISRDPEAHRLYEALVAAKKLLLENEPEHRLAETREFYWSKIEREIRKQAATPEPERTFELGWQSWWVRLAGAGAAVALLGTLAVFSLRVNNVVFQGYNPQEVESPADMTAITFHSESANMTVVWVQPREDTN